MKLMMLGDTHGNIGFAKWAVDHAVDQQVTGILQLGDFGIWTHTKRGVMFLDELNDYLVKAGQVLYFVDGNHENFEHLYDIPVSPSGFRIVRSNIIHVPRGKRWVWDGVRFMGFGGANSIDGPRGASWWPQGRGMYNDRAGNQINLGGWWPEEEMTQTQVDAVEERPVDVLLAHDCPQGIRIPGMDKTYPEGQQQRYLLRQVVDKVKPQVVYHGHYHVPHFGELDDGTQVVGLAHDQWRTREHTVDILDTEDWRN